MREIKFRIWDKKKKKMHPSEFSLIEFDGGEIRITVAYLHGDDLKISAERIGIESAELMQYTGVDSLKGIQIYEDDIAKGAWYERGKAHEHIGKVEYVVNGFKVRGFGKYFGHDDDLNASYEVIGNIYENPELLKEGEKP